MQQEETQVNPEQPQVEAQSQVLSQEEVEKTLNDESLEPEIVLPSDQGEFEVPDKFKGKSAEEIAKAYVELEKLKNTSPAQETETQQEEGGDSESPTKVDDYVSKVVKGEELTEEDYTKLQETHNMTKEQIDEQVEFIKYKQEKYVETLLADVGGKDLFKEAVGWAQTNLDETAIKEFNEAMDGASPKIQKVLARSLITQYQQQGNNYVAPETLHTNKGPEVKSKGYTSQHALLTDMSDPRYGVDRSYTKMVEDKMSITDDSTWG